MRNLTKDNVFPFVVVGIYVGVMFAAGFLAIIPYRLIPINNPDFETLRFNSYVNIIFYGTTFILFITLFLNAWKHTIEHFKKTYKKQFVYIAAGLVAMYAAMILIGILYQLIHVTTTPENQTLLNDQLAGPLFDKITLVLFAVFLAPVVEEFVFRLAMLRFFDKLLHLPVWIGIIISSLLFGGMHVMGDQLVQIVYYAALGIILATVYVKSNNIIASIAVHMIFNAFVTVSMFLVS